jgi:phage virion morphogenesis protein
MGTGIEIRVDVTQDQIGPALLALGARMGSLKKPLGEIGRGLVTATKKRFEQSRGPVASAVGESDYFGFADERWPPLAASTVAKRRTHSSKPLMDTATLMRSITSRATDREVHVGTNHELAPGVSAAIHQLGGKAGRGHQVTIPARPFLGIDRDDAEMIAGVVNDYLGARL